MREHEPEGTNNSSGRTHRYEETHDHRGKMEALAREVQCMAEDREAVEIRTYSPEMNRDNRCTTSQPYNIIIQRHPKGVGGTRVLKACMTSSPQ